MLAVKQPAHQAIATALQHYELLHSKQSATVILWNKLAKEKQWKKISPDSDYSEFVNAQNGELDRYFSPNEFYGWRLIALLAELRACYVDIDHCTDINLAMNAMVSAGLPPPNVMVQSGNGLHFYWLHEPQPRWRLPKWQEVQDRLCDVLAGVGADPAARDCTRVLRIVGSVNSKGGQLVTGTLLNDARWNFEDLAQRVLAVPAPPKEKKAQTSRKSTTTTTQSQPKISPSVVRDINAARARTEQRPLGRSIYDRWYLVYQDILAIGRYYPNGIPEGYRNTLLHLTAVALSWFTRAEALKDELTYLAKQWTPGISDRELAEVLSQPLRRATAAQKATDRGQLTPDTETRYRYRRETLYRKLKGLITAELEPELRAIISDELRSERRKERDALRDRSSRYKGSHETSLSRTKPWEALGISRATYYRQRKAASSS